MENVIIIGILVAVVLIGVIYTIKHFKGQGGCCGGDSSVKAKKKKLENIIAQKTVIVEGMTCDHCKNRVEVALNGMIGVSAKVNLKKKEAIVSMNREISEEQIRATIEKAGYQVVEIR